MTAIKDIEAERIRQIEKEGWTFERDDGYEEGGLARAAACYALSGSVQPPRKMSAYMDSVVEYVWPWNTVWWKPTDRRRDLVKAGALIVAEIERLDRTKKP